MPRSGLKNVCSVLLLGAVLSGCQTPGGPTGSSVATGSGPATGRSPADPGQAVNAHSQQSGSPSQQTGEAVAYVLGQPITLEQVRKPLMEIGGGQALAEVILQRMLGRMLQERGLRVTESLIDAERDLLLRTLDPSPDMAARLLRELRDRRGLGEERFDQLLRRNAALRLLVKDDVKVTDEQLRAAFEVQYGPRYEARLIVVPTAGKATEMVRRARAGESFIDLAIASSTDSSRAQGGLLPPISAMDPEYPAAVRSVLTGLAVGQVSEPVALEQGFAVLRLERKIDGQNVKLDDVKDDLARRVRLENERVLMQQKVRSILADADVTVLDPTLNRAWQRQRQAVE